MNQLARKNGPLSVRQRNAIQMAIRWRAESGPRMHTCQRKYSNLLKTCLPGLRVVQPCQTPRSAASDLVLHCLPFPTKQTLGLYELSVNDKK